MVDYKFLKLHLEWTGSKYLNRLELGDSSLNAPVDIRFIEDAGWMENVHSVFFSVNGRDAYYPASTGGLISTSDTGDLVFFDPSNENGRTLSQLYGGGGAGLWEVSGAYAKLSTARPLDIGAQNIDNVGERIQFNTAQIYSKIQFHGTANALIYTHTEAPNPVVDRWDFFINDISKLAVGVDEIDVWAETLDMNTGVVSECTEISGLTTGADGANRLNIDFRGDGVHRIYYTGIADNRLGYKTYSSHAFAIGANVTASIDANGLIMNTGKYIKSASGDLELRAPSGSQIKFVNG